MTWVLVLAVRMNTRKKIMMGTSCRKRGPLEVENAARTGEPELAIL